MNMLTESCSIGQSHYSHDTPLWNRNANFSKIALLEQFWLLDKSRDKMPATMHSQMLFFKKNKNKKTHTFGFQAKFHCNMVRSTYLKTSQRWLR